MAAASRQLCRSLALISRNIPAKRKCPQAFGSRSSKTLDRKFGVCSSWKADESAAPRHSPATRAEATSPKIAKKPSLQDDLEDEDIDLDNLRKPSKPITATDLGPEERADYEVLSKDAQEKYLALQNHYKAELESPDVKEEFERIATQIDREVDLQGRLPPARRERLDPSAFWADEEDDEFGQVEDDDDEYDEEAITTVAESELEVHREVREYMRIAAWDMPLLRKFAKPFEPPPLTSPLRFRYTTYMGESHPAAKKVVVEFCTKDLRDLTEPQRIKLIKLLGVRYNPDKDLVRMSCEKFENPAQNKRYLGDLIGKLVIEAKNKTDMFEDVPLDFRHHKSKQKPVYPEEWKLKPERVQQLLEQRQKVLELEEGRTPVDGRQIVEQYVHVMPKRSSGALM